MAFQKMKKPQYPRRHWSLAGYPGSGKSSFAAQMRGPKLVIDADHRFDEVLGLCEEEVYELSKAAEDNVDPTLISKHLDANMPGSDVKTIVVDSLTAIITPHVVQAMIEREEGRTKNLMSGFKDKALAMRMLQDSVTRWGTDTLWIYHMYDARDAKAEATVRSSVSQTELARLTRSINLQLQVVFEGSKRGIKVLWARRGRSGVTLWDEVGHWKGMPERIEEAVYGGLTAEEQEALAARTPQVFPNSETAIAWGMEQGVFQSIEQARQAYETVKREGQPSNAHEMASMWVAEVQSRLEEEPAAKAAPAKAAPAASAPAKAPPAAAAAPAAKAAPAAPTTKASPANGTNSAPKAPPRAAAPPVEAPPPAEEEDPGPDPGLEASEPAEDDLDFEAIPEPPKAKPAKPAKPAARKPEVDPSV